MLWDGVFIVMAVILAVNGFNRGFVGSWRGPLAMVAATFCVQQFYVDFAAWVTARLRVSPELAVIVGYLMLWFSLEAILEIVLGLVLKGGKQHRPGAFNRVLGIVYGLAKAVLIAVLPMIAASAEIKIPAPPPDKSGLIVPEFAAAAGSYLIPGFKAVAAAATPILGSLVISTKEPSFKPDYSTPDLNRSDGTSNKTLKNDLQNLLK